MELKNWISFNKLNAQISSNICSIEDKRYLILNREEGELLFDEDFDLFGRDEDEEEDEDYSKYLVNSSDDEEDFDDDEEYDEEED